MAMLAIKLCSFLLLRLPLSSFKCLFYFFMPFAVCLFPAGSWCFVFEMNMQIFFGKRKTKEVAILWPGCDAAGCASFPLKMQHNLP